ncbi:hypothetical protein MKX03_005694 [Papaver bracteatum]|nr:hypothetical protein MKX03_005694 [Papaver bracteatum]
MGDKAISRIRIIGLVGASRLEEIINVATTNLLVSASAAITLSGSNKYLQHIRMLKGSPYISRVNDLWGRGLDIMFVCKGYTTVYLGVRLSTLFALGAGQEQDLNALLLIFLVTHEPPSHTVAWVREAAKIRSLVMLLTLPQDGGYMNSRGYLELVIVFLQLRLCYQLAVGGELHKNWTYIIISCCRQQVTWEYQVFYHMFQSHLALPIKLEY